MDHRHHTCSPSRPVPRRGARSRRPVAGAFALVAALGATVAACGGDDAAAPPSRSVTVQLAIDDSGDTYRYTVDGPLDLRAGDEVTFEVDNTGTLIHDLQVMDPAGDAMAVAPAAAPGGATAVTVRFLEPGVYRLNCLVDDHLTVHGMQAFIEVTDADGSSPTDS